MFFILELMEERLLPDIVMQGSLAGFYDDAWKLANEDIRRTSCSKY